MNRIKKIFAILMMAAVSCNGIGVMATENEQLSDIDNFTVKDVRSEEIETKESVKVISGEKNILSAYKDSVTKLQECSLYEYDVISTATAEVYMGHAQNKSAKFTEELCKEQGIPFELTERQQETVNHLLVEIWRFANEYFELLENGKEFEKLNKENADWYTKLYIASPEYPEFKFELEMHDKYVKINETKNIVTGEIIPESYFCSKHVMFDEINYFCKNIGKHSYLSTVYEGLDMRSRTYKGEDVDYIEKLTFEIDVTEDLYYDFFTEIAELNETVKGKVEQYKTSSFWMYVFTFEGSKGRKILVEDNVNAINSTSISFRADKIYDEENDCFIRDERGGKATFICTGVSDSGKIDKVMIRLRRMNEMTAKNYVSARNIEYEFYKDSYEYNNRNNLFVLFNDNYTPDIKPEKVAVPEPVNKEDKNKENPEEKVEEKVPDEKEDKPKPETITVYINGEKVHFDQDPIIKENRTLVPMRAIFEALGAEVKWNEEERTVTAIKDGTVITIKIENLNMIKNGEIIELDSAPTIVNSRTLVPVRAVAESFGNEVSWNEAEMRVDVE